MARYQTDSKPLFKLLMIWFNYAYRNVTRPQCVNLPQLPNDITKSRKPLWILPSDQQLSKKSQIINHCQFYCLSRNFSPTTKKASKLSFTDPLWGKSNGHQWIPLKNGQQYSNPAYSMMSLCIQGSMCPAQVTKNIRHHDDIIKWNFFRVTGHLCGEFADHWWIPRKKASDRELWWFLSSAIE